MRRKQKLFVVFLQQKNESLMFLSKKRIKPTTQVVQYRKGNSHVIDYGNTAYESGLKVFYFFDINAGQLTFKKGAKSYNPALIDRVMKQSIVAQLTSSFGVKNKGAIFNIIIYIALGVAVGFIVRGFF